MSLDRLYEEYRVGNKLPKPSTKLQLILDRAENSKGVLTVLITLLYKKIISPRQDIRYHQDSMANGFSGRGLDTREVTPFLRKMDFLHMAESGWLTRSLEQPHPYDKNYPGRITPKTLKSGFLGIIDMVQSGKSDPKVVLFQIFRELENIRNKSNFKVARPVNKTIQEICNNLETHFFSDYGVSGASRLPVLAIYALYQCFMDEVVRYKGKKLAELKLHTSADSRSGSVGDIEIMEGDGTIFEALEIKHGIAITDKIVRSAYDKFKTSGVHQYLILSTKEGSEDVSQEINRIRNTIGCHVIVNGVIPTISYGLRAISNSDKYLENYANLLEKDGAIQYIHKSRWNDIFA